MKQENKEERMNIKLSDIPLEGSLGLLALGDIAFTAWRKLKKEHNIDDIKNS